MELTPESFARTLAALGLVDPRVEFVPGEDPSGPVTARVTSSSFVGRGAAAVVEELWGELFADPHFCPAGIGELICLKPSGD